VEVFRAQLDTRLLDLRKQILQGCVRVGQYRYFKVYDPKERMICAASFGERVLHHALMNCCHHRFDQAQVFDSYASRPGKGLHACLQRASRFSRPDRWFLKLDIRSFFAGIDHRILKGQLRRLFKEQKLLVIFDTIIDSYADLPGRGVPIGNLSSQYFANHYLSCLDHFIKEELRCRAYVRYMDDMVLWHVSKRWLQEALQAIDDYVQHRLHVRLKPIQLNHIRRGLPFCGYVIYPHYIRLSQRSKRRYIKKIRFVCEQHANGIWDEGTCQRHALPLIAFTRHADSMAFRRNMLMRLAGDRER